MLRNPGPLGWGLFHKAPNLTIFHHIKRGALREGCARLYKGYFLELQEYHHNHLKMDPHAFEISFALVDSNFEFINWKLVAQVVRRVLESLSTELPQELRDVLDLSAKTEEMEPSGGSDLQDHFDELLDKAQKRLGNYILENLCDVEAENCSPRHNLRMATKYFDDEGLVTFNPYAFDEDGFFMKYFWTRQSTPIELVLRQLIQDKDIQDENECRSWFMDNFFPQLRTPQSLNYPIYLNIVFLMLQQLDWKLMITGEIEPFKLVVEI